MALRGRRINNFLKLWCLVALGGLDIWVSSTSSQWPFQPHFIKKITDTDGWILPGTLHWLILAPFLLVAVEASRCYFLENWLMKLKCPNLLKPLSTIIQKKCWSFCLSEPFSFNMRHPVPHNLFGRSSQLAKIFGIQGIPGKSIPGIVLSETVLSGDPLYLKNSFLLVSVVRAVSDHKF